MQTLAIALELAVRTEQLVFGPRIAARHLIEQGGLVEVPVVGWSVREQLHVAVNSDRVKAHTQKAIVGALRARLDKLGRA